MCCIKNVNLLKTKFHDGQEKSKTSFKIKVNKIKNINEIKTNH